MSGRDHSASLPVGHRCLGTQVSDRGLTEVLTSPNKSMLGEAELVASFYKTQNADENGEYRANKYNRALGMEFRDVSCPVPALDANLPLEVLAAAVLEHGGILLKEAIPAAWVTAFKAAHDDKLGGELKPLADALLKQQEAAEQRGEEASSFYKGELQTESGLRLRTTARGRFDLKHLDRRDGPDKTLSDAVEPLVLPSVVRQLLQRLMATPWRVKTVGSLPTNAGASGGEWHRDIGEGLFGEELDLKLPDYYFNALVPLSPTDPSPNSGTEIVLGSHKVGIAGISSLETAVASGTAGDVFFFNGKCVHRGRPNDSHEKRDLVYVVYAAKWFEQGRDPNSELDDYLSAEQPQGNKQLS